MIYEQKGTKPIIFLTINILRYTIGPFLLVQKKIPLFCPKDMQTFALNCLQQL